MAQVFNDGDNLREFAQRFNRFQEVLYDQAFMLRQSFNRLGDSWQDSQYNKMEDRVNIFMNYVVAFLQSTANIPHDLGTLADAIDEYHNIN